MRNSFLRTMCGLVLFLVAGVAMAAGARALGKQLEASMRVTGEIHIATDGSVESMQLNHVERLGSHIEAFIRSTVMAWRFEPIMEQGVVVPAKAPLSLWLTAAETDDGDFQASISSVSFQDYDPDDETRVRYDQIRKPRYPDRIAYAGVMGEVFVVVKVGRDGRVADAIVGKVNLRNSGSRRDMNNWRAQLGQAALAAVRDWTFKVPTQGDDADAPYWLLTAPISFVFEGASHQEGSWMAHYPGPQQQIPWLDPDQVENVTSPEALADGGLYMIGDNRGPKLLTPLDPG